MKTQIRTIYNLLGLDEAFWNGATNSIYLIFSSLATLGNFFVLWLLKSLGLWSLLIFFSINFAVIYGARLFESAPDQSKWWPRAINGFRAWLYDDFTHIRTPSNGLFALIYTTTMCSFTLAILGLISPSFVYYFFGIFGLLFAKLFLLNRFAETQT